MSLRQHLTQQQQRLQDLLSLLEQEQRELSSGTINGEQLQVLAQQKQELQQQLEQAETQRRKAQQNWATVMMLLALKQRQQRLVVLRFGNNC